MRQFSNAQLDGRKRVQAGRRLADDAYLQIRDQIITVSIPPGAPLDEDALADELKIGLTPVREALKRLRLERLAVIYPRRGTFAAEINISDERWLTEVRVELEGLAAVLAAERASEDDLLGLKSLLDTMETADDPVELMSIDTELHRAIYASARNPFLEDTLNQYLNLALRIWHYCLNRMPEHTSHDCDQHAVVRAICDRDVVAARAAAEEHLRSFSEEVRTLLI
ncbi:GntR family transcriptional regulator [Nocardia sp. NPDC059246]|uniref:GntR family transcriptional regulator n=1 Tax=unclassified Nocardia TaxID=2637762 RepID=UPI0036936DE3